MLLDFEQDSLPLDYFSSTMNQAEQIISIERYLQSGSLTHLPQQQFNRVRVSPATTPQPIMSNEPEFNENNMLSAATYTLNCYGVDSYGYQDSVPSTSTQSSPNMNLPRKQWGATPSPPRDSDSPFVAGVRTPQRPNDLDTTLPLEENSIQLQDLSLSSRPTYVSTPFHSSSGNSVDMSQNNISNNYSFDNSVWSQSNSPAPPFYQNSVHNQWTNSNSPSHQMTSNMQHLQLSSASSSYMGDSSQHSDTWASSPSPFGNSSYVEENVYEADDLNIPRHQLLDTTSMNLQSVINEDFSSERNIPTEAPSLVSGESH